ncbi:hypothetical protein KIW84_060643 [Lathyrus oleraceus]|uniref:Zinc finger GRF-type domain-containing protein n=1 Tax=Pisum sativum TaxID=3888 RepID=A0A9D5A180_PEA|nr:hypothetical protein KIW84_060643 [Pisum sativum]
MCLQKHFSSPCAQIAISIDDATIIQFQHGSRSLCQSRYVCKCDLDTPLMAAWADANSDRRFYECEMYKIQGFKKCNHFVWLDGETNPRAKELISALLKNIN